eukprot:scaffold65139_cov50-Cyclotella_meneghiniana.AAC.2
MATKVLAKICNSSGIHQCKPSLFPLVVCTLVHLTIDHGVSPMSAICFAYYGSMIAYLGDLRGGHRFTKLAKALINKSQYNTNENAGEDTLSYIEPIQSIIEYRKDGIQKALAGGDIQSACANTLLVTIDQLWSGAPLTQVKEGLASAQQSSKFLTFSGCAHTQFLEGYDHQVGLVYLRIVEIFVSRLMIDENTNAGMSASSNTNPYQLRVHTFYQVIVSLVFDNVDEMKCYAEKYFDITSNDWYLQSVYAGHFFCLGLASFRIYRETREELWAQRANKLRERIQSWNEHGSRWNFKHKLELMKAEEAYSNGNFASAQGLYDEAVSTAKQHKFIQDEALAYELAAKFHFAIGNKSISLKYFIEAHEKYYEWNAFAKNHSRMHCLLEDQQGLISTDDTP